MKITIEHENTTATIEDEGVVDIWDAIILVRSALVGVGFHPDSVDVVLDDEAKHA